MRRAPREMGAGWVRRTPRKDWSDSIIQRRQPRGLTTAAVHRVGFGFRSGLRYDGDDGFDENCEPMYEPGSLSESAPGDPGTLFDEEAEIQGGARWSCSGLAPSLLVPRLCGLESR